MALAERRRQAREQAEKAAEEERIRQVIYLFFKKFLLDILLNL